eukprot:gene21572-26425_t
MPLPLDAVTIAQRLKAAGYTSGQVGKWHLEPNALCLDWAAKNLPDQRPNAAKRVVIPEAARQRFMPRAQGFDDYFCGEMNRYYANFDLSGASVAPAWIEDHRFRVDVQTDAALAFLQRNHTQPFFLYLAYNAPHFPIEPPAEWLARVRERAPTLEEKRAKNVAFVEHLDDALG